MVEKSHLLALVPSVNAWRLLGYRLRYSQSSRLHRNGRNNAAVSPQVLDCPSKKSGGFYATKTTVTSLAQKPADAVGLVVVVYAGYKPTTSHFGELSRADGASSMLVGPHAFVIRSSNSMKTAQCLVECILLGAASWVVSLSFFSLARFAEVVEVIGTVTAKGKFTALFYDLAMAALLFVWQFNQRLLVLFAPFAMALVGAYLTARTVSVLAAATVPEVRHWLVKVAAGALLSGVEFRHVSYPSSAFRRFSKAGSGLNAPRSHRLMVPTDTPSLRASCSWVNPWASRALASVDF